MSEPIQVRWEEVEHAAAKMFNIWVDGAELAWAKEVWGFLHSAGLTSADTPLERTAANLRLVTLARVYHEFCGLAWDENSDTPIEMFAEDLEIDPVALGILAQSSGDESFGEASDEYSLRIAALTTVSDHQRLEIFRCLTTAYGNNVRLYSRMWHTRSSDQRGETDSIEFEVTLRNSAAFEYVMNGFQGG
jgi:hypothetical protein